MYESDICEEIGLIASCNNCDRIIFKDENWLPLYQSNGGYCKECAKEIEDEMKLRNAYRVAMSKEVVLTKGEAEEIRGGLKELRLYFGTNDKTINQHHLFEKAQRAIEILETKLL